jgi:hypothetical protein
MAQTKRKRRTKHRGTAAGSIQTRGRTGRRPTAEERKKEARATTRELRMNTPPTWESAAKRGALAAALLFAFMLLVSKGNVAGAVVFAGFSLLLYIPLGYYTDLFLYRRRQRKKQLGGGRGK